MSNPHVLLDYYRIPTWYGWSPALVGQVQFVPIFSVANGKREICLNVNNIDQLTTSVYVIYN